MSEQPIAGRVYWGTARDLRSESIVGYAAFTCPCGERVLLSRPETTETEIRDCTCGRLYMLRVDVMVGERSLPNG